MLLVIAFLVLAVTGYIRLLPMQLLQNLKLNDSSWISASNAICAADCNYFTSDLEQIRDKALEISSESLYLVLGPMVFVFVSCCDCPLGNRPLIKRWWRRMAEPKLHPELPLLHGPVSQWWCDAIMKLISYSILLIKRVISNRTNDLVYAVWFCIIVDQDQTMNKLQRLSHYLT